jgi:hypothetical protein
MKIISKFKDYYDHISHIYGADPKIVYERPTFIRPEGGEYNIIFVELNGVFPIHLTYDGNDPYDYELLVICGRPFLVRQKKCDFKKPNENRPKEAMASNDAYLALTRKFLMREFQRDFFEDGDYSMLIELAHRLRQPVFLVKGIQSQRNEQKCYFSVQNKVPVLADLGVPKLLEATRLYQDIAYFISNVINPSPDLDPPVKFSDSERLQQHGFDKKLSFRHRK